jgi:Holliday junction resolvasome RuvABC endonuclease subunit
MGEFVFLGIDPAATKVSYAALFQDEEPFFREFKKLGRSGPTACSAAWHITAEVVGELGQRWPNVPVTAFIESPIVGRGGVRSTMVQCYTSGAIQASLFDQKVSVALANVSSWKKVVVGHGRATKDGVSEFVRLRWPALYAEASGSQDVADAVCIAHYGQLTRQ